MRRRGEGMPQIRCRDCQAVVFDGPYPFIKIPRKCQVCHCIKFCVVSMDDLERERLQALEASGCLISSLLD